uniref:Uncharacterized protein n=1 Tax=viral metagenome TaxID=1070528 RepID=A0A6C0B1A2_9ZZZZ
MFTFLERKKIDFYGFNLSCLQKSNGKGYIATIRQCINSGDCGVKLIEPAKDADKSEWDAYRTATSLAYPQTINKTFYLDLNNNFDVIIARELFETNIPVYSSFSKGIEDCRLIDEKSLLCVCLSSNPNWKSEMCYAEFEENKIKRLQQLYIEEEQYSKNEKNWLFLKKQDDNHIICLYHYNPLKVISVNIHTGKSKVIKEYTIKDKKLTSHGGACVYLDKINKYLVTIRNVSYGKFFGNQFLLLNDLFELEGISEVFNFPNCEGLYQMCMSLIINKNDKNQEVVHAFVGVDNRTCFIYEGLLDDILTNCRHVTIA